MVRNLSPVLRQELANLEKDTSSRRSAMKALKSYVKDLDSNAIPIFLAQVSETKETGIVSGEYTISLYEVLARVHGPKIVPQINSIMSTIIKTLASSAGSFPLQQACSKVVPAIARYGIDPTTPEDKKQNIIHSLCRPLSNSLMGSQESLTSGAALCLKALVDSDNWRFASDEMVNKVCLKAAGALEEKSTQTNAHLGLVMALAKHNPLIVEAYARLLIQSGLQILKAGALEGNSQKRLSAIQMVNFLMKCLDPRSIFSELELVIEELEKCQSDQMAFVKGAAFEASQTAKRILAAEKDMKFEKSSGSVTGSNYSRRNCWTGGDQSPRSTSPESQTLDYDSFLESPMSLTHTSHSMVYDSRSVNRKLWSYENGGVDVSLKDGLFSEFSPGSPNGYSENNGSGGLVDNAGYYTDEFAGFQRSSSHRMTRSATPSPQRSRHHRNVDNISIFSTPRKLIRSLQDPADPNSDFSGKQTRRFQSPSSEKFQLSPAPSRNVFSHKVYPVNGNGKLHSDVEQFQGLGDSESVSSTDDTPANVNVQVVPENKDEIPKLSVEKPRRKISPGLLLCFFFALLAIIVAVVWIDGQDRGRQLVPT
ncbi:hypothetical protein ACFE04_021921 [Oxalis oulophora]